MVYWQRVWWHELMEDENAEARRIFLAEHARKIKELDV